MKGYHLDVSSHLAQPVNYNVHIHVELFTVLLDAYIFTN